MNIIHHRRALLSTLASLSILPLAMTASLAQAQTAWPSRPITIIVPGAAGGTTDIPTRIVALKLSARLGQPVIVENKPGSGGIIGTQATLRNPADGYTLLVGNTGSHAISYSAYKTLSYKPDDFLALTDMISFANVLVVNAQSPIQSVSALISQMKKEPGKFSFSSAGIGQTTHLTGELFKSKTSTFAIHVPYRGATPATMSLLAGETQFMFDNVTQALPHIRSGKLRALAVTSSERMPSLPDTPTMGQAGIADFNVTGWLGFFVASKTPADIAAKLQEHLSAVMKDPEIVTQFRQMGGLPGGRTQAEFTAYVNAERKMWGDLIKAQNLSLD
ncbi:MAG: tripartite tricarboxylate transporter substrate binding protein [Polaromonas sp.]